MPEGLFQNLGKLWNAGATYVQHQQFIERLRGMRLEDAKAQLVAYVRDMPAAGFNGLKAALTLVSQASKDPKTTLLVKGLLESLDEVRTGRPATLAEKAATAQLVTPVRTFEEDHALVSGWYGLDENGRRAALSTHLVELSASGFASFREHVAQMSGNTAQQIQTHEANEDNAMGGFIEDRINYRLARLKTGQRDPQFVARLKELQSYGAFYDWVGKTSDVAWPEGQRLLREEAAREAAAREGAARETAAREAAALKKEPPPAAPEEPPVAADGGAWQPALAMLRVQLQQGLASGEIRAERKASYERLLDKMETLMTPLSDPATPVAEKAKLLDRFRGLMAEFQQSYVNPGPATRLDHLSETARARTLEHAVEEMKGVIYRDLAQAPPEHTRDQALALGGDLTSAHQLIDQLTDDAAATRFEREMLRGIALGLHDYTHSEHLMLARPLWQCAQVMPSANGVFYSGANDLAVTMQAVAARLRIDIPSARGQYYGQARWDALRGCFVGVFDLRGYSPNLIRADSSAAAALAGTAYELGLAFALGKPVVILTSSGEMLPFDIDIAPCELGDDADVNQQRLTDALDHAWYGRQRTPGASGLMETFAYLDRLTRDHPRRHMLEASGLLDARQTDDAIGFIGSVKQILREQGLGDLQPIFPAWPGRYPSDEAPSLFHVMPFSEPWSDAIRDAARATARARGYAYGRGDEADDGRIIQAIWDDISAAHVVLVDITGLNLNVMIELGMAHALGRTVLMARQDGLKEPLPRNIEKLRALSYDGPAGLAKVIESRVPARTPST
jgi:nucleoside 2-deoxyribosyltransferase